MDDSTFFDDQAFIIWHVKQFFSVTENGKSIWSPRFKVAYENWKIEIYPNGKTESDENNVSVFLHMTSSTSPGKLMSYKVCFEFFRIDISDFKNITSEDEWAHLFKDNVASYKNIEFSRISGTSHGCSKLTITSDLERYKESRQGFVLGCSMTVELSDNDSQISDNVLLDTKMFKMYKEGDLTDTIIKVGDDEIKCHKIVLSAKSTVLKAMLSNPASIECQSNTVESHFSIDSMKMFVEYLYTSDFDKNHGEADDILEMLVMADYYGANELKQHCMQNLMDDIVTGTENVLSVLKVAHKLNITELIRHCVDILISNPEVMETEDYKKLLLENAQLCFDVCLLLGERFKENEIVVISDLY